MNFTISGHHLDITSAIREHVENKLERVKRHFDHVIDVNVILSVAKLPEKDKSQKAEVTLQVKGKKLHAESVAHDLYAAIDLLIDKLDRQVIKYKDQIRDHKRESVKHHQEEWQETFAQIG